MQSHPSFGSASVIFELGFALNGAIPALYASFATTQGDIIKLWEDLFRIVEPAYFSSPRKRLALGKFAYRASSGLRMLRAMMYVLVLFLLVSTAASFVGIVIACVDPDKSLEQAYVISSAIVLLIVLPGFSFLYAVLLNLFAQRVVVEWSKQTDKILVFLKSFELVFGLEPLNDKMEAAMREAKNIEAQIFFREWKLSIENAWRQFRHPIQSFKLWRLSKSLDMENADAGEKTSEKRSS